jgi:hypothetical protein
MNAKQTTKFLLDAEKQQKKFLGEVAEILKKFEDNLRKQINEEVEAKLKEFKENLK